jgi:hypothetical protein
MTNQPDLFSPAFFMADHAAVESGKLYANGAFWNRLQFPSYPAVVTFGIAAVLSIPWRAYHQPHKFSIWFEDADGKKLSGDLQGEFTIGAAPDMKVGDPTIMPIAATVGNFAISSAGDYSAVLNVDGQELNRWPFRAVQVFSQTQPSQNTAPLDRPEEM